MQRRQSTQNLVLSIVIVVRRTQIPIALAGLVGEHLESSLMVMGHIGVPNQACIQLFVLAGN